MKGAARRTTLGSMGDTDIHSPKLTWNPKRSPLKRTIVHETALFRFHVCLAECSMVDTDRSSCGCTTMISACSEPSGDASQIPVDPMLFTASAGCTFYLEVMGSSSYDMQRYHAHGLQLSCLMPTKLSYEYGTHDIGNSRSPYSKQRWMVRVGP